MLRPILLAMLAALAGGCAKPPPMPTLSLEGRSCTDKPDLAAASAVPLENDKPVSVMLDDKAPCLQAAGAAKVTYAAFSLPQSTEEYVLTIISAPIGEGRFSPRMALLDAGGDTLREIPPDMFMARGTALRAGLRRHSGERYLVISADPDTIGQTKSQIVDATKVYQSGGGFQIHTGVENNVSITNAYNGTVTVLAQPIPKAK